MTPSLQQRHCQLGQEHAIGPEIAAPQAARLLQQPIQPLQAAALHPLRRHLLHAGMEIERRAHTDLNCVQHLAMLKGEHVLLGTAQADEDQPRAAAVDAVHDSTILRRR
jgi:hypothetical protein